MKVSVLINNYNYSRYLDFCIQSVLTQSYPNIETILYDDGSTDNSVSVAEKYKYQITIISNPNHGKYPSFNQANAIYQAFLASSGDIVCLLDSDDAFLPNKIEEVVAEFDRYDDAILVQHLFEEINSNNKPTGIVRPNVKHVNPKDEIFKSNDLNWLFAQTSALSFRKPYLDKILPLEQEGHQTVWPDVRLTRQSIFHGDIVTIHKPLSMYRVHLLNDSLKLGDPAHSERYITEVYDYFNQKCAASGHPPINLFKTNNRHRISTSNYLKYVSKHLFTSASLKEKATILEHFFNKELGTLAKYIESFSTQKTYSIYSINDIHTDKTSPINIYIFGSKGSADLILKYLDTEYFKLMGFFDNDQSTWGKEKNDVIIEEPVFHEGIKVIIASVWTAEISKQLLELGYDNDAIIRMYKDSKSSSSWQKKLSGALADRYINSAPQHKNPIRDVYLTQRYKLCSSGFPIHPNEVKLRQFGDKHKNDRCFIIGNGPSLNEMDLSRLKSEFTFGVNAIYLNHAEMGFYPTYYAVEDVFVAEDRSSEINAYRESTKFIGNHLRYCLKTDANTVWLNVVFNFANYEDFPHFSQNVPRQIFVGGTVSYQCMQLAHFMGFKEVYLIGFDHNYTIPKDALIGHNVITSVSDDPNHFSGAYFGAGKRWHDPNMERMEQAYGKARLNFENSNRKIVNATLGGNLEVFERVDYNSLF